jgi:hypothetical protein
MRRGKSAAQRGAIAVMVALMLTMLLLVAGIVLDLGHVHVVKDELQNAADACALSAARELNDRGTGALERATAAATVVAARNKVDFQADTVEVPAGGVTFAADVDGPFARAIGAETRFARCETPARRVSTWLMWIGGRRFVDVNATAIAGRVPGQSLCAIPLAMCAVNADASDLVPGTWYTGRLSAGTATSGNYDWIRFPGLQGARDLADLIAGDGLCDVGPAVVDSEAGIASSLAQAWNTRFGLYAGRYNDITRYPPDRTGYAYTPLQRDKDGNPICIDGQPSGTWPEADCAGNPLHVPPQNAYPDYVNRANTTHTAYDPWSLLTPQGRPEPLSGNPSPLDPALHASGQHLRRMVFVPIINCNTWEPNGRNMPVIGYACALMLAPVADPDTDVMLEYHGLQTEANQCPTTGFPGTGGPPVAALVR